MASASLPHQGRFAPLRGAQEGILDPSARPPPCEIAGTGRGTGFSGPNKEHGLAAAESRAGAAVPPLSACLSGWTSARDTTASKRPETKAASPEGLATNFVRGLSIPGFRGADPIRSLQSNRQFCALYPRGFGGSQPPRGKTGAYFRAFFAAAIAASAWVTKLSASAIHVRACALRSASNRSRSRAASSFVRYCFRFGSNKPRNSGAS